MSANQYREALQNPSNRVIVALDNMDWGQADDLMSEVGPYVGMGKANDIADELGWRHAVNRIAGTGALTMADPKLHDIPKTVKNRARRIARCQAALITLHAGNEQEALEKAVEGRDEARNFLSLSSPEMHITSPDEIGRILGVTVLTSLDAEECISIYGDEPEKKVIQFAHIAADAGIDGIVCSAKELKAIRAISAFDDLLTVVPGITPDWAKKPDDQSRTATPAEAILDGADYLVIGRAITEPPEGITNAEAAQRISEEIKETL